MELDIDIGADAKDWSAVQATEKLKPIETELRRIEDVVGEIVTAMEYLRGREQKLRDTNESTNTRVKWFAWSTMGILIALGAWQIMYLRAYFRYIHPKDNEMISLLITILDRNISSKEMTSKEKLANFLPLFRLLCVCMPRVRRQGERKKTVPYAMEEYNGLMNENRFLEPVLQGYLGFFC